jgi:hypothetical protein
MLGLKPEVFSFDYQVVAKKILQAIYKTLSQKFSDDLLRPLVSSSKSFFLSLLGSGNIKSFHKLPTVLQTVQCEY